MQHDADVAAVRDELPPVNVHSDEYSRQPTGYRMVYYKTATMLFNLLTDLLYQAVDPRVQLK